MKPITKFAAFFLIGMFVFASCKKENPVTPTSMNNNGYPPVAHAGNDVSLNLACSDRPRIELDGSGSSDHDNNIVSYRWEYIYGMQGTILNPTSVKASVENMSNGEYAFELTVKDASGWSSKDTVLISIKGLTKEYDLDITFKGTFSFTDNNYSYNPWDSAPIGYYDLTIIQGKGSIPPLGEFNIYLNEYADTAALSDKVDQNYFRIALGNVNPLYFEGNFLINFKKLIRQGGGLINGSFTITSGSAQACKANVFTGLAILTVTGSLDVNTQIVTLRIQGKVYF